MGALYTESISINTSGSGCILCRLVSHDLWSFEISYKFIANLEGFTADGSVENFKRRRQTELKHGRISMLATMGYITPEITGKFPGYLSPSAGLKFADVPNGLAAISKVPAAGWGQILAYMAFCEVSQDQSPGTPAAAGDFGFKVLTSSDPAEKTKKLSAELANGRLAMMAIIGMFFQDIPASQTRLSWSKLGRFASSGIVHGYSVTLERHLCKPSQFCRLQTDSWMQMCWSLLHVSPHQEKK